MTKKQLLCLVFVVLSFITLSAGSWFKNPENKAGATGYARPHLTADTRYVYIPSRAFVDRNLKDGMIKVTTQTDYMKNGYFNSKGDQVFGYEWSARTFSDGVTIAKISNGIEIPRHAILYKDGTYREFPHSYVHITDFVDGVALASLFHGVRDKVNTEVIYINTKGENVFKNLSFASSSTIAPGLVNPPPVSEGLRAYFDFYKNKYGYIDTVGNIVIPARFLEAGPFSEGLAAVAIKEVSWNRKEWAFIDKTGKIAFTLDPEELPTQVVDGHKIPAKFGNGLCPVSLETEGINNWYYIDKTGKKVSKDYERAFPFYDGYAIVRNFNPGNRLLNEGCTVIINTNFQPVAKNRNFGRLSLPAYSDGLIRIGDDASDQNFIYPNGQGVLESGSYPNYISEFENGLAFCLYQIDGKEISGIINKKGEFEVVFTNSRELVTPHTVPEAKKVQ